MAAVAAPPHRQKSPFLLRPRPQKARAHAEESLSKDLSYFFSGDYLSACDLSTAMGRLIPAVIRGDVKPRTARTVAYMAQILLQSIHMAQDEYINTFGTDGWRKSIRNPPSQPKPTTLPRPRLNPPQQPRTVIPSAARIQRSGRICGARNLLLLPTRHSPLTTRHFPNPNNPPSSLTAAPASPPKATPPSPFAPLTPIGATSPAPPEPQAQPAASQPNNPPEPLPSTSPREPSRDTPWWEFGDTRRIRPDSKLL